MATRQQAVSEVVMHGGTIDWDCTEITGLEKSVLIDAPDGYVWQSNRCPVISIYWACGPASELWDEVIEQVRDGVEEEA